MDFQARRANVCGWVHRCGRFIFQLTAEKIGSLRLQFATLEISRDQHRKHFVVSGGDQFIKVANATLSAGRDDFQ
jgi:hypothetical protein